MGTTVSPVDPSDGAQARHPAPAIDTRAYVAYVIALLALVNVFNYVDRMALSVLAPAIKSDLHLSDGELGLLTGLAFSIFYAICAVPIARVADRGPRRTIIALALAGWSVMTALSGFVQSFWQLCMARIGVGAAEAGCLPPGQSLICDVVPLEGRTAAFSFHQMGLFAGMFLGMVLAGLLGDVIGWRWTFVALGLPGVLLALVVRFTLREPPRGRFEHAPSKDGSWSYRETIEYLWRCRTSRYLLVSMIANGYFLYGVNQWAPSFYTRAFGMTMSDAGLVVGPAVGLGSLIGLSLGGFLPKSIAADVERPLRLVGYATFLILPGMLGFLFVPVASVSIAMLFLTSLFCSISNGPQVSAYFSVIPARIRATSGAIQIFLTAIIGFGLGPVGVGVLSDMLAPALGSGEALRYALLTPLIAAPIYAWSLVAASRVLVPDLRELVGRGANRDRPIVAHDVV